MALLSGFDSLPSFDQINLGSTLLQSAVIIGFAVAQQGVARHFDRPGMRAIAGYWALLALAVFLSIFSSWSGAVWNERTLSRAITALSVSAMAAGIPFVQRAITSLLRPAAPSQNIASKALQWGVAVLLFYAVGVFGSATLFPEFRVLTVSWSRVTQLIVLSIPAVMAWRAWRNAREHHAALQLLFIGLTSLAARQLFAVLLGLRVGMPDLPLSGVIVIVTLDVLFVSAAGVFALLASTAEEVVLMERQAAELARVQQRLAQGERMESLGRMAAAVAHDMNNVLQVLGLTLESLRERLPRDARGDVRGDAHGEVGAAMQHGRSLTAQLLTFARARPTALVHFDPAARLHSLDALLRVMAGASIELQLSASARGASLLMDPAQFEQIVINLVANARDASDAGGRIAVSLDLVSLPQAGRPRNSLAPGEYIRLIVADTGMGIPSEIRDSIFEPFFTTKSVGQGTGLGLATVHGIAKEVAGDVLLESTVGRGSTFEVYLPAA
ncbi:sensor histidine kinase [Gemmatimonas sp.]|uniref:sensor histidine kinase n=1 Tax=Gemmatimonas sp. TaxID=1962908 RepID=UPI003982FFCA